MSRGPAVALLLVTATTSHCNKPVNAGDPLRGLSSAEQHRFRRGRVVFDSLFTPEKGLGPLFNATGCGECHEEPVAGGSGDEVEVHATAFHAGAACDPLAGEGGPVIQLKVTPALKAALGIDSEPFPKRATGRGRRTSLAIFGRGLLDAVPDAVILSYADSADRNHDGIRGRPNRFVPTLDEFNAGAFVAEMGVTDPAQPTEETIGGAPIPPGVDPVADPEINQEQLDLTNDFVRFLAPPSPAPLTNEGRRGRELFSRVGCAGCHIPALRTGDSPVPALARTTFYAYTDLLLHDMGPDLADICLGLATPSDFRTEPLIGLRLATHFLHDGRAKTPEQAIELHAGEGARARDLFQALPAGDRAALVAFLKTL